MPDLRGPDRQPAFLGIPTYIHSPLALSQAELAEMQADVAVIGAVMYSCDWICERVGCARCALVRPI